MCVTNWQNGDLWKSCEQVYLCNISMLIRYTDLLSERFLIEGSSDFITGSYASHGADGGWSKTVGLVKGKLIVGWLCLLEWYSPICHMLFAEVNILVASPSPSGAIQFRCLAPSILAHCRHAVLSSLLACWRPCLRTVINWAMLSLDNRLFNITWSQFHHSTYFIILYKLYPWLITLMLSLHWL